MARLHPIHVVTLLIALLAAVFSFVAMQAAFDARDEARTAGSIALFGEGVGPEVRELHEALVRAGVVDDPTGRFDHLGDDPTQDDQPG